ncbi:MAG: DUF417 family protein [Chloroflexi bacterium]|nr:DUF417 family protein [Chloroflexota bacterium]
MNAASLQNRIENVDRSVTRLLAKHSLTLLRISVGIVFVWFGALKFFPGMSPAEPLIRQSITFLPMDLFLPFLAAMEVFIGICYIVGGRMQRLGVILMLGQMAGAMSPLVLRPDLIWSQFPFVWTLEGQYVFKDIVLISVALVIGATVRGGGLIASPVMLKESLKRGTQEFKALIIGK